jgi:hypothetical protein
MLRGFRWGISRAAYWPLPRARVEPARIVAPGESLQPAIIVAIQRHGSLQVFRYMATISREEAWPLASNLPLNRSRHSRSDYP